MSEHYQYCFIPAACKTRLQELIERFNTWPQARFYLEHKLIDDQDCLDERGLYQRRIQEAERTLKALALGACFGVKNNRRKSTGGRKSVFSLSPRIKSQ